MKEQPWLVRAVRAIAIGIARTVGVFIILAAALVLFAQTDAFQRWVRENGIAYLNEQLEGKIVVDDVYLDVFKGIRLIHPRLYANGTTVLDAASITLSYDLSTLFVRVATVTQLDIDQPRIHILKSERGDWNINHIVKPSESDEPASTPQGTLVVRSLTISNGSLIVNAGVSQDDHDSVETFDPTHLHLAKLNLNLAARLNPKDHDVAIAINRLSFVDELTGALTLDGMNAIVRLSPSGVDVQELLVAMPRTIVRARCAIRGVDVFRGFSEKTLTQYPLVGRVESDRFWGPDLHYFIPDVDILDEYRVRADVEYAGNSLRVSNLELEGGPNTVEGSVFINELYGQRPLSLDIMVTNTIGNYADVQRRLRFVGLPTLPFLTQAQIDTAIVRGQPTDSLWIQVHASDRPGRVDGTLSLLLNDPELGYHLDATIANGDLSAFADSASMATSLNGKVEMHGRGLTLQKLQANARINLERSIVLGRQIRQFNATISGDGKGLITVDTLFANLTPFGSDTTRDAYQTEPETASVRGWINTANPDKLVYSAALDLSNLNLARIVRDNELPTDLSAKLDVNMEGIDLDSLHGRVNGTIGEFVLRDRAMMPFALDAAIERKGLGRAFNLNTDFATVTIDGQFVPTELFDVLGFSTQGVSQWAAKWVRHATGMSVPQSVSTSAIPSVNLVYAIRVRDLSPLNMVVPDVEISGAVDASGKITSDNQEVAFTLDSVVTSDLQVVGDSVNIRADRTRASVSFTVRNSAGMPDMQSIAITYATDSILNANASRLTRPTITIQQHDEHLDFTASTWLETMYMVAQGKLTSERDAATMLIDSATVILDSANKLQWSLVKPAAATLANGVINVESLVAQRPWAETVSISGIMSDSIFHGATARVENFPLVDVPKFAVFGESHPVRLLRGLVTQAQFTVNGTWHHPTIEVNTSIADVSYNNSPIGNFQGSFFHRDGNVQGFAQIKDVKSADTTLPLNIQVKALPLDLSFTNVQDRIREDAPWDIRLSAANLNLAVAEPFLPAVERVHGKANAELSLIGNNLDDVKLSGNARYWNGSFLSSSTNIMYTSEGTVSLNGQVLNLDSIVVRNLERDHGGGVAVAKGSVVFDGLTVDSIDFVVRTPTRRGIMVLSPSSQARSPIVYGDLIIASGEKPIRMYGKLETPKLVGDVDVLYSDITFPRERSSTKARTTTFDYVQASDASTHRPLRDYLAPLRSNESVNADTATDLLSQTESAIKQVVAASTASFVDILDYNLRISLRGRTLLTMVLSPFEILVADLELVELNSPLLFTGKFGDNSTNLKGSVRLKEGTSTYKFYKPFQTGGTLNFASGGMMNPDLNLVATYQNRRITNDKPEEFKVQLNITGTKLKPRIAYRLWRNDREIVGDSAKIASDALMLILVGKTTDEMMASGQGDIAGQVNAAFSSVATSALSDVISGVGFVQNAQIDLGSDISQSRITLSGQLYGDISYRVSGQISDFSGNSTFTVSIPLSVVSNKEAFRLFQTDFSHTVNNTGNITRQTRLWEIKFGARLP